MTDFLLLIGAGLFSKATIAFERYAFNRLVGSSSDDTIGTGPGSYRVQGNVWHLDCCSPSSGQGWSIFNAIFGWSNDARSKPMQPHVRAPLHNLLTITSAVGSVLSYIIYWLAVIVVLVYMKYKEVSSAHGAS